MLLDARSPFPTKQPDSQKPAISPHLPGESPCCMGQGFPRFELLEWSSTMGPDGLLVAAVLLARLLSPRVWDKNKASAAVQRLVSLWNRVRNQPSLI